MTIEAEIAKDVGYKFECKKDGLSQLQNGSIKVVLTINPVDMPQELYNDTMGQRYIAVLVPLNDDETPREEPQETPVPSTEKPKRDWDSLAPAQQAGILCGEDDFRYFITGAYDAAQDVDVPSNDTATILRHLLGIESRREIAAQPFVLDKFNKICSAYRGWQAKENQPPVHTGEYE